jgi:hypothetical protein
LLSFVTQNVPTTLYSSLGPFSLRNVGGECGLELKGSLLLAGYFGAPKKERGLRDGKFVSEKVAYRGGKTAPLYGGRGTEIEVTVRDVNC